jgi:DNA mismatch repair protein MutL
MCITALETAYKHSIMVGKFPPCVIFINLPFSAVDVNVHPAKTEVRFFEDKKIFDAVYQGALNALTQDTRPKASFSVAKAFMPEVVKGEQLKLNETPALEKQEIKIEQKIEEKQELKFQTKQETQVEIKKTSLTAPKPETVKPSEIKSTLTLKSNEEKTIDFLETEYVKPQEKKLNISINTMSVAPTKEEVTEIKEEPPIVEKKIEAVVEEATPSLEFRIIGEAFKTYIFVELENKMLMIDKHAAHERILFEKFKSQQTSFQQMLLVPVTVTLSPDEYNAVLENKELLYKAGYDMEDFGDRCVKVNACPTELVDEDIASITMELASYLSMNGKTVMPEKLDWIYHSMACRAAIKAGNTTTDYELRKFVEELLSREDIRYCPHGRPVMVEVSKRDLEKQFKRIV